MDRQDIANARLETAMKSVRRMFPELAPEQHIRLAELWLTEYMRASRAPGVEADAPDNRIRPTGEKVTGPLVEALRGWRKRKASDTERLAHHILHNRTLDALAEARPYSIEELARVVGMGPWKVEHYGGELLALIRQHATTPAVGNGGQVETEDEEYERIMAKQTIRAALVGKRMTEARIATVTKLPPALVARALASLVEQQQVTQRGGKWSLVKKDS